MKEKKEGKWKQRETGERKSVRDRKKKNDGRLRRMEEVDTKKKLQLQEQKGARFLHARYNN